MRVIRPTAQVATSHFGAASIPLVVITGVTLMFLVGCGVGETSTSGGEVVSVGAPAPTGSGPNHGGSPVVAGGTGPCGIYPEFMYVSDNPNPTGSTPRQALYRALSAGAATGNTTQNIVGEGYPARGWRQVKHVGNVVTFQAKLSKGLAELTISRVTSNSWVLASGLKRCDQPETHVR
jgi:hypothetical protein